MNFCFTEEQVALQDVLRRFIAEKGGLKQRQLQSESKEWFSRENWQTLCNLGISGLPFPEEYGGIGGGPVDLMLVMESIGRGMLLQPFFSTVVLAGGIIRDIGSPLQKESLVPAITAGSLLLALAHYEPGARYILNQVATTAVWSASGWRLNGTKSVVLGAPTADKLIISARTSGAPGNNEGISLFIVDRSAKGVILSDYRTHDGEGAADILLQEVELPAGALLGPLGEAMPAIEIALMYANVALCAEAVGIVSALIETTAEYLKTRRQFGVALASFQALRHRMADMYVASEQARSITYWATLKASDGTPQQGLRAASGAKALVMRSARLVGQEAVQLHGGMGVTDELDVGHYFKRLTMIGAIFGDVDYHLGRFGDTMLADNPKVRA